MRHTPRKIRRPKYSAAMLELQRVSLALVDAATAAALNAAFLISMKSALKGGAK